MTNPNNHEKKATHVRATWVRRCDGFLFISSKYSASLPSVALNASEGRDFLWSKTKAAFAYSAQHHLHDYDWFLKADDDTYVVMPHLREFLADYDSAKPAYFGCKFKMMVRNGYMSGGSGYVLSSAAVSVLGAALEARNDSVCPTKDTGDEDVNLGLCMQGLGVPAIDTRDSEGRLRFVPHTLSHLLFPTQMSNSGWVSNYAVSNVHQGWNCCSPHLIAVHYVKPEEMYLFDFLLHFVRRL